MRKSYIYLLAALALPAFVACDDDDNVMYKIENPVDQMQITPSAEEILLTPEDADKDVLTFTWNLPANRGEGSVITSYFRMDIADNNFETATDLIELAPDQTSITFTGDDLNDYLLAWGISPESPVKIDAQIIASVENENIYLKPEITKTTVLMSGYAAVSRDFFVDNSANDGWYDNQMNEIVLSKQYSIVGWFDANVPVKFAFDLKNPEVTYTKGADNNTLVRTTGNEGEGFKVPATGYYEVKVNLKTLSVSWSAIEKEFDNLDMLYVVGAAFPCGWVIENSLPMVKQDNAPHIWSWTGMMTPGDFKCPLSVTQGWSCDFVRPLSANVNEYGDDNMSIYLNPDNKWYFTSEGLYTFAVNTWLGKVKFVAQ